MDNTVRYVRQAEMSFDQHCTNVETVLSVKFFLQTSIIPSHAKFFILQNFLF